MICRNPFETNQKAHWTWPSVVLIIFGVKRQEHPAKAGQMINWPENGGGGQENGPAAE